MYSVVNAFQRIQIKNDTVLVTEGVVTVVTNEHINELIRDYK